jgi:hypothetical protein
MAHPRNSSTGIPHSPGSARQQAGASSLLDTLESNQHPPTIPDCYRDYDPPSAEWAVQPIEPLEHVHFHKGWEDKRQKVWAALHTIGAKSHRLDRFANCGSACYVEYSPKDKRARLSANFCHDRFCLRCGAARARTASRVIEAHLQKKLVRFATLTLRRNRCSLTDQITRLLRCFAELRRNSVWKSTVAGGCAFLEVKWIAKSKAWHPHLHLLIETPWLPQKELSERWYAITGDSYIVDIRPIKESRHAANYVCKYASKPMDDSAFNNASALAELIKAMRGRRTIITFGTWRGLDLDKPTSDPGDWVRMGRLVDLLADASAGDAGAIALVRLLTDSRLPGEERNTS